MIGRGLTAIDFLYNMTDGDLHEVIEDGEIERFCNALTLDLNELKNEGVTNQA
tara:strand:- start:603 stop:761 length:159 start_codon:yes stop_codon:yes gene_type:complete